MDVLAILEVAIGIVMVYLILSLVCTSLTETFIGKSIRRQVLRQAVSKLLGDDLTNQLYETPEVAALRGPTSEAPAKPDTTTATDEGAGKGRLRRWWDGLAEKRAVNKAREADPSYIPTDVFARSVLDLVTAREWKKSGGLPSVLREQLVAFANSPVDDRSLAAERKNLGDKLTELMDESGGDIEVFKNKIELWFDRTGDRSKGWFKRRLNRRLILLGFLVAAAVNADTIMIFQRLTDDPALREAAVQIAIDQLGDETRPEGPAPDAADSSNPAAAGADADAQTGDVNSTNGDGEKRAIDSVREQVGTVAPFVGWSSEDPFVKAWTPIWEGVLGAFDSADSNDNSPEGRQPAVGDSSAGDGKKPSGWAISRAFIFALAAKFVGLSLTAFAISLGAPFWFNLLQKLINIRGSVKASRAKDLQQEGGGSEDGEAVAGAGVSSDGDSAGQPAYTGPMAGFSPTAATVHLGNAYWLARAAQLAYETDNDTLKATVASWGMIAHPFSVEVESSNEYLKKLGIDSVDTQGFVAVDDNTAIVCFRGTEPTEPGDIVTDIDTRPDYADEYANGGSRIHRGFKAAIHAAWDDKILPLLLEHAGNQQSVWFAGHSLGGALAVLAASRYDLFVQQENQNAKEAIAEAERVLALEPTADEKAAANDRRQDALGRLRGRVAGTYTIGQPRVGDKDFAAELDSRLGNGHVRIINNRDVVPRVPLRAMGFRHSGTVLYFDEFGRLHRDPGLWYRLLDTVVISREEVAKAKEGVKDHDAAAYVDLLDKARKSNSALTRLALR